MKGLAGLLIACFIFFSVGCGGGSDNKTEPNQNENIESSLTQEDNSQPAEPAPSEFTPISESEFEKLTQVGTWRISSRIRTVDEPTYATNLPSKLVYTLHTTETVTSNKSAYQFCNAEGVITNSTPNSLPEESNLCEDETNIVYLKKDDDHFKSSITCKNGDSAEMDVSKISNEFGFNLGSLKFLPETLFPAINANNNVCANVIYYDFRPDLDEAAINALPNYIGLERTTISIFLPYAGSSFLHIIISFPWKNKKTLKPGTYHVDETNYVFPQKTSANFVMIQALQEVPQSSAPDAISPPFINQQAKSGTVNLESFDELEAKGTYEFTAFGGEKVTGSFSYSLK